MRKNKLEMPIAETPFYKTTGLNPRDPRTFLTEEGWDKGIQAAIAFAWANKRHPRYISVRSLQKLLSPKLRNVEPAPVVYGLAPLEISPEALAEKMTTEQRYYALNTLGLQSKIEAIKYIRTITGAGLREAKVLFERPDLLAAPVASLLLYPVVDTDAPEKIAGALSPESREKIKGLLAQGNKVGAIKEIRIQTGFGLKVSFDLVSDHAELFS